MEKFKDRKCPDLDLNSRHRVLLVPAFQLHILLAVNLWWRVTATERRWSEK